MDELRIPHVERPAEARWAENDGVKCKGTFFESALDYVLNGGAIASAGILFERTSPGLTFSLVRRVPLAIVWLGIPLIVWGSIDQTKEVTAEHDKTKLGAVVTAAPLQLN